MKIKIPKKIGKILLVGLNYKKHARELKMAAPSQPVIFSKPNSAIILNGQKIIYPKEVKRLDYEAELALVIKKKARKIKKNQAKKYILGYTCLNDVTARDLQEKDKQWFRAKSFDTFCPIGPWVETNLNPDDLKIESYLNGKLKQSARTSDLIFSIEYLVWFISNIMTLEPGDIISTGTPSGIGPMQAGDKIKIAIEGIGCLENQVTKEV